MGNIDTIITEEQIEILERGEGAKPPLSLIPDKQISIRERVKSCGKGFIYLKCPVCNRSYVVPARCNSRFCPRCAMIRSAKFVRKYEPYIEQIKHLYFLTLTIKNVPELTKSAVNKIIKAFRELRRLKVWGASWGIWSLEVTNEGKGWHLHIHALINRYLDINEVRNAWYKLTGANWVYVEYVRQERRKTVARELLKYVSKLAEIGEEALNIMIEVFGGRRLLNTFGSLKYKKWLKYHKQINKKNSEDWWKRCECGCKLKYEGIKTTEELIKSVIWWDHYIICPICRVHYRYFAEHLCEY